MTGLTENERDSLSDFDTVGRITEREFRIDSIDAEQQLFWIEDARGIKISFIVNHIDPQSEIGQHVQELSDYDFVTLSADRLQKSTDHMPRWFVTEITDLRSEQGTEQNAFGDQA